MTAIEIDVKSVQQKLKAHDDFLLLDCREPDEYEFARIEGSTLIPMNQIPQRVDELDSYREKEVVVYCHLGGRSLRVVQWLRENGFEQAQNMTGGISAWTSEIDPTVPSY